MVRPRLSEQERLRGRVLGRRLRQMRGSASAEELARRARVSVDTLRKIEAGGVAVPGFFIVARIVHAAGGGLDDLWRETIDVADHTAERPR